MDDNVINQRAQLESLIKANYTPAANLAEATLKLSTQELFEKFAQSFPGAGLSMDEIFQMMARLGFHQEDYTAMNFVWVMRED